MTPENPKPEARKPYETPEIIHELALETRAGSPLFEPKLDVLQALSDQED